MDANEEIRRQIRRLADRLDRLEGRVSGGGIVDVPNRNGGGASVARDCALPFVPERRFDADVSEHRADLIRYVDKKWMNGTKLRYWFFDQGAWDGPESEKDLVREAFDVWSDVGIGIRFEEVGSIDEAEVRIGFLQSGRTWSYVGRDVIDVPGQHERTMNYGWRIADDSRGVDVPVHEIGHTLGFPHEHQNPFAGIVWDEEAVYRHFARQGWDRATTDRNVLRKLSMAEVEGSEWDPDSIMHYGFPAGLILEPAAYRGGIQPALGLTDADREEVRRFFPPNPDGMLDKLEPFRFERLQLEPMQQANFQIEPTATRDYTIQTFGQADTVMVLFEDRDGELRYVAGDDDSGTALNARIETRLVPGRRYVLRIRLYLNWASGETGVLLW